MQCACLEDGPAQQRVCLMLAAVSLQGMAPMTIGDLGSIANLLAAIGVLVTLIYLARQVRQGNAQRPTTDYFTKIGMFDREPSPAAS